MDERGNTNHFGYNAQFSLTGSTNGAGDWVTYNYNTDGTLHSRTDPPAEPYTAMILRAVEQHHLSQ